MKNVFAILLLFFSAGINAEDSTAQQNLRTLFTTAHEREQLNKLREQGKFNSQEKTTAVTKSRKPITLNMQGVVIRKNHQPVVFINNSNNLKSNKIDTGILVNPRTSTNKNYIVPIKVNQNSVKLKPGQQWSELNKTVQDAYQTPVSKHKTKTADELAN